MSTEATPAAKKPGPAKKQKQYGYITVDKNNYTQRVSDLANKDGATILNVTTNPNVLNSFDVHYFILK